MTEHGEIDHEATEYLTGWLTNDYRFAHEAGTLLDYSQDSGARDRVEAQLDRFCFLLVWELRSTVAGHKVLSTDKRWELTQLRHRLPQEVFRRIDWSDVREQLEDMEFPPGASGTRQEDAALREDTMKLTERIKADGVELDAELIGERIEDGWRHRHYEVTLTMDGRSLAVEGGYQAGMGCDWPTTADVLACVRSDATCVETTEGYEEWAREFETDPEKWEPVSAYEESKRTTQALRTLLGDKYDAYLYETDDDT